jgi:DNA primase
MSVEAVLRELKIDYAVTGNEAVALCPNHEEIHPSWSINLKSGLHHCFACGFKGSLDGLVMRVLNSTYAQAHMWVAERTAYSGLAVWRDNKEEVAYAPAYLGISEHELYRFTQPPEEMLRKRNLTPEAAELHGILWNPEKLSWVLPIRDPYTGDLWGWQEKSTVDRRYRNYPGGIKKSKTLFGLPAFEHGGTAILVESPLDVVRLSSAGIRGGLSSYGVSVSDCQLAIVHRVSEHLVLALDDDRAGMAETDRIGRDFKQLPVSVFFYGDGRGKDPGELTDQELINGISRSESVLHRKSGSIKGAVGRYRHID